jgi:hypothetical protein
MRSRVPVFALAFTAVMITLAFLPAENEALTVDPYEVYPGTLYLPLVDYDEKGDTLSLTITFKGTSSEDYQPRGIDILIVEESRARRTTRMEFLEGEAVWIRKNVTLRVEEEITNPTNSEKAIVFNNPVREGDNDDWDNATVRIRIDYEVNNKQEEDGMDFIPILVAIVLVIVILVLISMVIIYFKRRSKDARTFFNPETGPYYAFRSVLDGKTYYIDPDQYARLYESNSLGNYDFLGTAARIGGTITPPEGSAMEAAMSTPMEGQIMTAVPIDQSQQFDLASLQATPVDPQQDAPRDNQQGESPPEYSETQDALGMQSYPAGMTREETGSQPSDSAHQEASPSAPEGPPVSEEAPYPPDAGADGEPPLQTRAGEDNDTGGQGNEE